MKHPHRTLLGAIAGVLLLAACGEARSDPASEIVFDTLPNGAVHVQNPETGIWRDGEGWRLVEDLRIGTIEGEGPEVSGQIRGIEADAEGRIYVLDHQAHAVQVFDADGRHLRTLGSEGAGPGEFRSAFGLRFDPEGRLWVADHAVGRYTLYDPSGEMLEMRSRPFRSWGFLWGGFFAGDHLVEADLHRSADGEATATFVRYDREMQPVDTVPQPGADFRSEAYCFRDPAMSLPPWGCTMAMQVPFSANIHRVSDGEGRLWVGTSDQYRVALTELEGDTVRIVEREHTPVPVTRAEREEALASDFLERMRERGGEVDPNRIPDHKPAFTSLFVDDRDHLWVRVPSPEGEEGTRLDVFDPDGRYLGQLRSPVDLQTMPPPVVRGGALYGVVTDDFDVQYLVRFRIEGRS